MKKTLIQNAFQSSLVLLVTSLAMMSCQKETTGIAKIIDTKDQHVEESAKPVSTAAVSLKMTVNNSAGYNITSDGSGDYVTGLQNVSAKFDAYGNFIFSCGLGGRGNNTYLVRWLNINFSQPFGVITNPPPITGNDKVTAITTIPAVGLAFTPLQSMTIGQSQCVGLTGGSGANWVMNFHRGTEDVSSSPSAYAVFTKISSVQWTVTPAGTCSANSNVCALRNGPDVLYGYYTMPFSFTLTKL